MGLVLLYRRPEGVYLCLYRVRMRTEGFPLKHWVYVGFAAPRTVINQPPLFLATQSRLSCDRSLMGYL